MKKITLTIAATTFALCTILTSCSSSSEKAKDAREDVEKAKVDEANAKDAVVKAEDDSIADFNTFKTASDERIKQNELQIANLKTEIKEEQNEAKARHEKEVSAFEERNEQIKQKIKEFNTQNKKDWENFKTGINEEIDKLGDSLKKFADKNKSKK